MTTPPQTHDEYVQQLIQALEPQVRTLLENGHTLTVRWDCGGDESFVYTQLDGQELPAVYDNTPNLARLLDQYLTERLDLPSAGEFSMQGTGRIFQEGAEVVIEYESRATGDNSWMEDLSDEELAEMGYTRPVPAEGDEDDDASTYPPDEEMSAEYTGRQVLFKAIPDSQ
ncbi:MAG: hypothetical protein ACRYFX_01975 [Janthinobacterium lividum]